MYDGGKDIVTDFASVSLAPYYTTVFTSQNLKMQNGGDGVGRKDICIEGRGTRARSGRCIVGVASYLGASME